MVQFLEGRNRAWAQLDAPINGSDTNVALVAWQGSRLSDVTTASGRKVRAQMYERDAETGAITKCELVDITNNVSDVLIIERAVESTRATDTTNTYAATPQSFSSNAIIEEVISSEVISEIQDEVNRIVDEELPLKANQSDVDALINIYAASSGGTDNYAFTIPWFVSYAANVWKHYTFLSDVPNAGASWVNISGLGNIPMYKQHDQNTETGDIEASQLVEIVIGPGGTYVEMVSQVAKILDLSSATPPAIYDTTFAAWEDLTAWNAVFAEPIATFAASTTVQAIWDVTARTRFSIPWFGSGVAGSTLKLSLKKFVSPSVALGIRIETDNAWSPSGTLVHANATGTVAAASLSTSLADTTITLWGSFTITAWQKVHIVLFQGTYGSETINATNYYGVGYSTNNTTTRGLKLWNGTTWAAVYSSVGSTNATLAGSSPQNSSSTAPLWLQYLAINDVIINTITKNASTAATKAYIKNDAWTILDTMTFSGNVATPTTTIVFPAGTYFRVELDDNGASFANRREQVPTTYPQVWTDVSITSNSLSGANDPVGNQNNSIITINTGVATLVSNFTYLSSALLSDNVLSKTDSDYSYKVDWLGISSETVTAGLFPKVTIAGINANQTGITHGSTYYINATPGSIGTSPWTNSKKIAKWHGTTKVNVIQLAL